MSTTPEYITNSLERRRLLAYTVLTTLGIGSVLLALSLSSSSAMSASTKILVQITAIFILTLPIIILMQAYLEPTRKKNSQSLSQRGLSNDDLKNLRAETDSALSRLNDKLEDLNQKISERFSGSLTTEQFRSDLANHIKNQIETQASNEILENFQKKAIEHLETTTEREDNLANLDTSRSRMETEIFDLGRRGNLNLILGGVTSLSGVVILGVSVYFQTSNPLITSSLITYFLPRLALAAMIQVFAYFFLSLYRNSLQEIKYFQNEITNIEAKHSALSAAMHTKDKKIIELVLTSFSTTERNHILLKNQTTVELEKIKSESNSNIDTLNILKSIISEKIPKLRKN